jgi:transcriptional regulator of met regulon
VITLSDKTHKGLDAPVPSTEDLRRNRTVSVSERSDRIPKGLANLLPRFEDVRKNRHFTVSEEFDDIHVILDNLPHGEVSLFICEAIRQLHQTKTYRN